MPTIDIRFTGGTYHATPWGSHVNEGLVEWPPSPWRLLRAMLAVGFNKLQWQEPPPLAQGLITALAEVMPAYQLPPGDHGHTRHYMPPYKGNSSRVFDAFIRLEPDQPLRIHWPATLTDDEQTLLAQLVQNMSYLGRAESWIEASIGKEAEPDSTWCRPCINGDPPPPGGDQTNVFAPLPADTYSEWREACLERIIAEAIASTAPKKLTEKKRERLEAPYPKNILQCLLTDTAEHQRHGWNQPPGSRRVLYNRPDSQRVTKRRNVRTSNKSAEAALLSLISDTEAGTHTPLMKRCLPQAELLHRSLVSNLGEQAPTCPSITGRAADGSPCQGHRHAHYIPLSLEQNHRIDHVLIYAPMAFEPLALQAIQNLSRTWMKDGDDILVACTGIGALGDMAHQLCLSDGSPVPALGYSKTWVSVTPFVPPRHLKKRTHTLHDQVQAELQSRALPEAVDIQMLDADEISARHLRTYIVNRREGKPQPPVARRLGLQLTFAQPVRGPIALGYASHYGLGLFAAE